MSASKAKFSVKGIILSVLGCVLLFNILATVMNDRYGALQVKFDQSVEIVHQCFDRIEKLSAENRNLRLEVQSLKAEMESLRGSIDLMKAQSQNMAKEEYIRMKEQLQVLSNHFEEMGKKLAQ